MPIELNFKRFSHETYLRRPSDHVFLVNLAAGVAEQITLPAWAECVLFSATGDFYAKVGTNPTASAPASDILDGTASTLNPAGFDIIQTQDGTKISLISAEVCKVTVEFYK